MTLPDHLILNFHIKFREEAKLQKHLYSSFRGAFGHALKQVSCLYLTGECRNCIQKKECDYNYIFETPVSEDTDFYQAGEYASHPYVLVPPLADLNSFSITLFGRGVSKWKTVVRAVQRMGPLGIGSSREKFRLCSVISSETEIWNADTPGYFDIPAKSPYNLLEYGPEIKVSFFSPAQIRVNKKFIREPAFHDILRLIIRRLKSINYWHIDEAAQFEAAPYLEKAKPVKTLRSNTRWLTIPRYSNRQETKMKVKAMVGSMDYKGDFSRFSELLAFAQVAHIGKKTAFGFGKILIE
ncbi:MAG: CRISPR system precrRNA processing endoribonuclease RAMP protein Cas6 [Candidatus Marinimicrobia bacterium]|nr:CRISPR system precrRNA processing endoribonuclease RAMP protein Cas6 [Candidatus Neomarinimicrobiota bacterium]